MATPGGNFNSGSFEMMSSIKIMWEVILDIRKIMGLSLM